MHMMCLIFMQIKPSLQFTSMPVWPDEVAFQKESGWFDPSLSHVCES